MRWIHTSLPLSFGGEDDGEEFDVRFCGIYYAGSPGCRYGAMAEPPAPASFEVYEIGIKVGGPSGDGWIAFPNALLTERLYAQLSRIGVAEEEARVRRDREDAEMMRRTSEIVAGLDALEAGWAAPAVAAE